MSTSGKRLKCVLHTRFLKRQENWAIWALINRLVIHLFQILNNDSFVVFTFKAVKHFLQSTEVKVCLTNITQHYWKNLHTRMPTEPSLLLGYKPT